MRRGGEGGSGEWLQGFCTEASKSGGITRVEHTRLVEEWRVVAWWTDRGPSDFVD